MIGESPTMGHHVSCDRCGNILDPGAADAPMGGYPTEAAAENAADAHGWAVGFVAPVHFCPDCIDAVADMFAGTR